jgi:phage shock protein A
VSTPYRRPDWVEHVLQLRETAGRLDERLGAVESRLDRLEERMHRLEDSLARVQNTMYTVLATQTVGSLGVIATILATQ